MSSSSFERVVIARTKSEIHVLSDFREITALICFSYGMASTIKWSFQMGDAKFIPLSNQRQ